MNDYPCMKSDPRITRPEQAVHVPMKFDDAMRLVVQVKPEKKDVPKGQKSMSGENSYILIEVPAADSKKKAEVLTELRKEFDFVEVRTRESKDGCYRVVETFSANKDAIREMKTKENVAGNGWFFAASEIIFRLTGDNS